MSAMVKKSKVLRISLIPRQPGVNVTFPCSLCDDGSRVVHFTDIQYQQMNERPMDYPCQKCVPPQPTPVI